MQIKKIKTSSLIIIILIPVLLFTSFEARRSRQQYIESVSEYIEFKHRNELLEIKYQKELITQCEKLMNIELVDVDDQTISIEDVVKEKMFVYRFTESTCQGCVEEDLERVLKLGRIIGFDRIVIIPDYRNIRLLQAFSNRPDIQSACYNYNRKFSLGIENHSGDKKQAFFLLLSKNLKIHYPFIASANPELNDLYFDMIVKYFGNN